MKSTLLAAFCLAAIAIAAAAPSTPPPDPAPAVVPPEATPATAKKKMKMKAQKPMRLDEPMKTPMAKDGMMMGDVKANAAKKDATMGEMIRQEESRMPTQLPPGAIRKAPDE